LMINGFATLNAFLHALITIVVSVMHLIPLPYH
jgi:hypothetical protein